MSPPPYIRGFTLLEMLVVLIIVGLVSALLFQGVAYVAEQRGRFLGQLEIMQQGLLQEYWFRGATAGLVADHEDTESENAHRFKGEARRFEGLSLAALDAPAGVPTPFTWELREEGGDTVLLYRAGKGEAWTVARWPGKAEGFTYLAEDGTWHPQWPPTTGLEPPQLPWAVSLAAQRRQGKFAWVVKLADLHSPRPDYRLMDN